MGILAHRRVSVWRPGQITQASPSWLNSRQLGAVNSGRHAARMRDHVGGVGMLRRPPDPPVGKACLVTTSVARSSYHDRAPLLAVFDEHSHLATGGLLAVGGQLPRLQFTR